MWNCRWNRCTDTCVFYFCNNFTYPVSRDTARRRAGVAPPSRGLKPRSASPSPNTAPRTGSGATNTSTVLSSQHPDFQHLRPNRGRTGKGTTSCAYTGRVRSTPRRCARRRAPPTRRTRPRPGFRAGGAAERGSERPAFWLLAAVQGNEDGSYGLAFQHAPQAPQGAAVRAAARVSDPHSS